MKRIFNPAQPAHMHTTHSVQTRVRLFCISLYCWRKLEYLVETEQAQAKDAKTTHKDPSRALNAQPCSCTIAVLTTMALPPQVYISY